MTPLRLLPAAEWNLELLALDADALDLLWARRLEAWRSPAWTLPALARLDERIEAHADALVLAADDSDALVDARLAGDDPAAAVGAAHVLLLREDGPGVRRADDALLLAAGASLDAFRIALRHVSPDRHRAALAAAARGDDAPRAAAALAALAFHGDATTTERIAELTHGADAGTRRIAWEAVGHLGAELLASASPRLRGLAGEPFRAALRDPDPAVREAVREAAAWAREGWLLQALRAEAAAGARAEASTLRVLALLGGPADLPLLVAAREGVERLALLGALGAPGAVDAVLEALGADDLAIASAAASAFRRLTGVDVATGPRARLSSSDPDADEMFLEEVRQPDAPLARRRWRALAPGLAGAARICHGVDVSRDVPADLLALVDLETRRELALRLAFERRTRLRAADLERFPQRVR